MIPRGSGRPTVQTSESPGRGGGRRSQRPQWVVLQVHPAVGATDSDDTLAAVAARVAEQGLEGAELPPGGVRALRALTDFLRTSRVDTRPQVPAPGGEIEEIEAETSRSPFPPLVSLRRFWIAEAPHMDVDELAATLASFEPMVEEARPYHPPCTTDVVPNDPLVPDQTYLNPAPVGVDAHYAWSAAKCDGAGVTLADVEMGWSPHNELPTLNQVTPGTGVQSHEWHGTAVLGVILAADNKWLTVGIAPEAGHRLFGVADNVTTATIVYRLVTDLKAGLLGVGDVVLLPIGTYANKPIEQEMGALHALRLCAGLGLVVVASAGNGGLDLDTTLEGGGTNQWDSGAILVGASGGPPGHVRWAESGLGARVNCFAAGVGVYTLDGALPAEAWPGFWGTSAASSIIAGAAILVQQMAAKKGIPRLSPLQMRKLLSDPALGTDRTAEGIGVMPDLRKIWDSGLMQAPVILVRDNLTDTGSVPVLGSLTSSPDIFAGPHGMQSVWPDSVVPPAGVESTNPHQAFVRVRNIGGGAPSGVSASLHYTPPATLAVPSMWQHIGDTTRLPGLTAADGVVTLPAIDWIQPNLPSPGHYCFIAIIDHAEDPAPAVPDFSLSLGPGEQAVDRWVQFVRNNRHVAWRNFNAAYPTGTSTSLRFLLTALPDEARDYELELVVEHPLPESSVALRFPATVEWRGLPRDQPGERRVEEEWHTVQFGSEGGRLGSVVLRPDARHQCLVTCRWAGEPRRTRRPPEISVRQHRKGRELGRVTWTLRLDRVERER